MERLLPLDPSWGDVARLDDLAAQIACTSLPAAPKRQLLTKVVLPAPLPPPSMKQAGLASQEQARITRVVRQAMTRLNNLRNTLDVREARLLALRQKAIDAQAQADIAEQTAADNAKLKAADDAIRKEFHIPIRNLWFKQFALETQVNGLPAGAAREQAVKDLHTAEQERGRLEAELARRLAQSEEAIQAKHEAWVQNRRQRAEMELAAAQNELHARTEAAIQASQRLAELILKGLEPLEPPVVPSPENVQIRAIPASVLEGARLREPSASEIGAGAVRRALMQLQQERARLVRLVTQDLKRRITAIALQQGWRISFQPVLGGRDVTQEVARLLRTGTYTYQEHSAAATIPIAL